MGVTLRTLWLLGLSSAASAKAFEPLEHLGANSPWFAGRLLHTYIVMEIVLE